MAALVAGGLGAPVFGQDFDARPVYYAMLQAAESRFAARVATIESARRASRAALERREARARARLDRERARIEREQRAWESAFAAEREALDARMERLGAMPPRLAALADAWESEVEGALVAVNAARSRYRALAVEARARRDALESAFRAYRDGDSEEAKEIDRLARTFEAFHAEQSAAIDEPAAGRRRKVQEFDGWQQEERVRLREMRRRRSEAVEAYAALAREHERRLGELNRLVRAYNERGRSAAPGEADGAASSDLARGIERHRETLEALRARATALARDIEERGEATRARQKWFDGERARRERALTREADALRAGNERARARIETRRRETQARVEAVEARVVAGFHALAEKRSEAVHRIESEFGPDADALLTAAAEWLGSGDHSLLYHADGRERFARDPLRARALYDAIDAARRAQRHLVDVSEAIPAEHRAARREEQVAVAEGRRKLLAARLASASRQARRWSGWAARRDAAQREIRRLRAALRSGFEIRLARIESEFRPLQQALLEVLGASPPDWSESRSREDGRPDGAGAAPPVLPETGEGRGRHAASLRKDGSLDAPGAAAPALPETAGGEGRHASRPREAASPGDPFEAPAARSRGFFEDLAAAGRERDPRAPLTRWGRPCSGPCPETRVLEGDEKRRLLAQWYRLLSARGTFDPLAHRLSRLLPAHSGADRENGLRGLFEAGMQETSEIVEYRGADRNPGYEIRILGRCYRLDPDGRFVLAPCLRAGRRPLGRPRDAFAIMTPRPDSGAGR